MSSGRFDKICKLGEGEFLQAHISKCPVADLRKICKPGGDFLHAGFSKCPVADLTKSANWGMGNFCKHTSASVQWQIGENLQIGGGFLQAHISKCPVADLRKICKPGGDFCMQVSVNVQWQI